MIAKLEVTNPNQIQFTLTVTMSLEEWKDLDSQFDASRSMASPRWELGQKIQEMIQQSDKTFYPKSE